ncbi:MAG: hypothetical protein ACI4RN_08050 [Oscillospiraceae bacterium]
MNTIVKVSYQENPRNIKITCNDKVFDTSNISEMTIEDLAYPFCIKGVKWSGLYEELRKFTSVDEFTIFYYGDSSSFDILKQAMENFPVKLVSTDNKVIILYSENPFSTKITVNGSIFDTERIQNRSIDEWINPIQIRDLNWKGIFNELADFIGIDIYTIEFAGNIEFMKPLIDNCPKNVDVVYKNKKTKVKSPIGAGINTGNIVSTISSTASNAVSKISSSAKALNKTDNGNAPKSSESDEKGIPIKNEFIRKNAMAICALLSLIFTVLPFFKVVAGEGEMQQITKFSGITALFGKDGTFISAFLFIGPLLLIIMNYISQLKPYRKIIAIVVPSLSIIFEILITVVLKSEATQALNKANSAISAFGGDAMKTSATTQIGFWLLLLSYILTAVVGFMTYYGLDMTKKKN